MLSSGPQLVEEDERLPHDPAPEQDRGRRMPGRKEQPTPGVQGPVKPLHARGAFHAIELRRDEKEPPGREAPAVELQLERAGHLFPVSACDPDGIEAYRGTGSLPFERGLHKRAAVKIIDDRGIESLKVIEFG